MARYAKGTSGNPRGRPVGRRNRVTVEVRTAILEALNSGDGAVAFFKRLKDGSAEDRRTFAQACTRILPRVIEGDLSLDMPPRGIVHVYVPNNGRGPKSTKDGSDGK